jgi:hypothetical protein
MTMVFQIADVRFSYSQMWNKGSAIQTLAHQKKYHCMGLKMVAPYIYFLQRTVDGQFAHTMHAK